MSCRLLFVWQFDGRPRPYVPGPGAGVESGLCGAGRLAGAGVRVPSPAVDHWQLPLVLHTGARYRRSGQGRGRGLAPVCRLQVSAPLSSPPYMAGIPLQAAQL